MTHAIGDTPQSDRQWFPCVHPERPNDPYIVWHYKCRGCHVAAVASQRRWPDVPLLADIVARTQPDDDCDEAWL